MATLVTGAAGHIGSLLTRTLLAQGENVVAFDIAHEPASLDIADPALSYVRGDVGNLSNVLETFRAHRIERVFHLGAILSVTSEDIPWASHQTNVQGTLNLLEIARAFETRQFYFASSRGTYGLGIAGDVVDDLTLQRPTLFYGAGKLYCEGVGRWYRNKYGFDFRSLRYPTMIAPGVRTGGHWAPAMIEDAVHGRPHVSQYGAAEDVGAFLYVRDAVRATLELMAAPKGQTEAVVYNIAGMRRLTAARELGDYLAGRFPGFTVIYRDGPAKQVPYSSFDDSCARRDWGWSPQYDTLAGIVDQVAIDLN